MLPTAFSIIASAFTAGRIYTVLFITTFSPSLLAEKLIVYTDNWVPYNFQSEGKLVGISADIVKKAFTQAGIDYEIRTRPWVRAYKIVSRTANTALFTIQRSAAREATFKWAGPIIDSNIYLYKLKSREDIKLNEFADLSGFRIAALNGGAVYQHLIANGLEAPNLYTHGHAENHINLLFAKRVDLIPGDEIDLRYQLRNGHYNYQDVEKALLLYKGNYHIAFNENVPDELINKVQKALGQLYRSAYSEEVIKKYVVTSITDDTER